MIVVRLQAEFCRFAFISISFDGVLEVSALPGVVCRTTSLLLQMIPTAQCRFQNTYTKNIDDRDRLTRIETTVVIDYSNLDSLGTL